MKKGLSINSTRVKAVLEQTDIRYEMNRKQLEMEEELRKIRRKYEWQIEKMESDIKALQSLAKYGWIFIEVWSRDCDMCESSRVYKFQSVKKYNQYLNRIGEWAEGPVSVRLVSKDQYDAYAKPNNTLGRVRDRIMEAYENGNGNSILV